MIVVTRFDLSDPESESFLPEAEAALDAFAVRPGFVRGRIGRATDDPTAWVLTTEWDSVGSYRRSLSSYDVKVIGATVLGRGTGEISAFEVLAARDTAQPPAASPSTRAQNPVGDRP